jgi:hypothetical protein
VSQVQGDNETEVNEEIQPGTHRGTLNDLGINNSEIDGTQIDNLNQGIIQKLPKVPFTPVDEFDKGMDELRAQFPSQTDRLWRVITSATLPIIKEVEPVHPAVILLVADQGSSSLATCLAQRYAELVTKVFSAPAYSTFNCQRDTANKQPDEVKRELDNKFTSAFEARSRSGVVLHIENLPGKAAMIFYRFCDNDNAPFKDVSIVLTLTLESAELHSEKDSVAFSELRRVWESGINHDKIEPLFSRIGNSIAFVKPETGEALQKLSCPLL